MKRKERAETEADEWWIDWMEGEVDQETEKDLMTLIRRSVRHRKRWREWQELRNKLKNPKADVQIPAGKEYWSDLNAKIMKKVKKLEAEKGKSSRANTNPR